MQSQKFEGHSADMRKPTNWLASEDLMDKGDVKVTIEGVYKHVDAMFDNGRKETVFSLKFVGAKKELVLNATNRKTLVKKFGTPDVTKWAGKEIALYVEKGVKFQGKETTGIRIRP